MSLPEGNKVTGSSFNFISIGCEIISKRSIFSFISFPKSCFTLCKITALLIAEGELFRRRRSLEIKKMVEDL